FDEGEEAFLITLSAQLSGVIAAAEASGAIQGVSPSGQRRSDTIFNGVAGAPGVAIGTAVVVFPLADLDLIPSRECTDIDKEIEYFNSALNSVRQDMLALTSNVETRLSPEERELFGVYVRMLDDDRSEEHTSELQSR